MMYEHPGMGVALHPQVRCCMLYFGAVFSFSSIAWGSALPCKNCDKNVSRIMKNVIDAFIKEGPLLGSPYVGEGWLVPVKAGPRSTS